MFYFSQVGKNCGKELAKENLQDTHLFSGKSILGKNTHGFLGGSLVVCLPVQEAGFQSLIWKDPLQKDMATHSSVLVWEIPWIEKPDGFHGTAKEWNTT